MTDASDPVLQKRARISRLTSISLRVGAAFYLGASALFAIALMTEFSAFLAGAITLFLILGSVVLAPAMVFHYAVKAAYRADRENSW